MLNHRVNLRQLFLVLTMTAMTFTIAIQWRQNQQLTNNCNVLRAAYVKQGAKLDKYIQWYWNIVFDNN